MIRTFEEFSYPDDIPEGLDKEQLYASGDKSTPGERIRNFMTPIKNYFSLLDLQETTDKDLSAMIDKNKESAKNVIPYIEYWLKKVE